jgi:hypothetical protein
MDEVEILKATLNNTIARYAKKTQEYEVEIANMTAQIVLLQSQLENSFLLPDATASQINES